MTLLMQIPCRWRLLVLVYLVLVSAIQAQPYELDAAVPGELKTRKISDQGQVVNYAYAGTRNKTGILFLHGTPGSWQAFAGYLKNADLQRDFFMVSIDRPGWGRSINANEKTDVKRFDHQAKAALAGMQEYPE